MNKIAVVYWSGTGNTETMANAVVEGAKSSGNEVDLFFSDDFKDLQFVQTVKRNREECPCKHTRSASHSPKVGCK